MRSTAPTRGYGPAWKSATCAMCWPWPKATPWPPRPERCARTRSPASCRRGRGSGCRPGRAALDEHQVRRWASWYRWVTLAMLALAFLTVAALAEHAQPPPPGMIPLTRNEIASLLASLIIGPGHDARHRLRWSAWRRRHQYTAQTCHYRRQSESDP